MISWLSNPTMITILLAQKLSGYYKKYDRPAAYCAHLATESIAQAVPVHINVAVAPCGVPPAAEPVIVTIPVAELTWLKGAKIKAPMSAGPDAPANISVTMTIVKICPGTSPLEMEQMCIDSFGALVGVVIEDAVTNTVPAPIVAGLMADVVPLPRSIEATFLAR